LLPGKLLERAGIHDAPYFALTELVGSQLAALTAAPGAPPLPASNHQQQLDDHAMASISQLRLKGKLDSLLLPPQVATHATAISAAQ
jgi:hypothetical protein